ncbi:MAG TPA: hypothetical protein PLP19_09515 [bacterium]|nr:hypothetical protein [bacterium]HPN43715.1 hypothetical protein [bacterium]
MLSHLMINRFPLIHASQLTVLMSVVPEKKVIHASQLTVLMPLSR